MDLQDAENENREPEEHVLNPNEPYPVVISPFHFVILCLATFGMYAVWWQYKCWKYFKEKENSDSIPILWTLLYFLLALSLVPLLNKIEQYCLYHKHRVMYNPFVIWIAVIALNLAAYKIRDKFPLLDVFIFLPLIFPVMEFNFYFTGNRNGYKGDKLNTRQIVLLVLGALGWASILQAVLTGNFPPPTPDFLK